MSSADRISDMNIADMQMVSIIVHPPVDYSVKIRNHRPSTEVNVPNSEQLLQAIKGLPTNIASELIKQPSPSAAVQELSALLANAYVATLLLYRCCKRLVANGAPQYRGFRQDTDFSHLVKQVVDQSANDFVVLSQTLNRMDPNLIASLPAKYLFDEAVSRYRPLVADIPHVYARRAEMKEKNESDPPGE